MAEKLITPPIAPEGGSHQNSNGGGAEDQKDNRYWNVTRIIAFFGLIEALSLVLWCKSEDFTPEVAYIVRWVADCGFLAGGAFLAHKFTGKKNKCLFIVIIWSIWIMFCFVLWITKANNPYRPLIPANDPLPIFTTSDGRRLTGFDSDAIAFFFGGCLFATKIHNPSVPIVVSPENTSTGLVWKPLLEVSLNKNGASVSGKFFDKDGKIVAVLRDNVPIINSNNSFDVQRPDASTLIVHDQYDVEVINIRYLRPSVFMFTGIFRSSDGAEVVISKSNVKFTKGRFQGTFINTVVDGFAIYLSLNKSGIGGNGMTLSN